MILSNLYQFWWSVAHDSHAKLPAFVKRHLTHCPRCRRATEAMRAMECSISVPLPVADDEWLQNVMHEVKCQPPPHIRTVRSPHYLRRPLPLTVAAVAASLVFVLMLQNAIINYNRERSQITDETNGVFNPLLELTLLLENERSALVDDLREASRIATECLPLP
jgi:hypothetical protein